MKELYPSANFKGELHEMEEEEQSIQAEVKASQDAIKDAKKEIEGYEDVGGESDSDDADEIENLLQDATTELKDKERDLKELKRKQKEEKAAQKQELKNLKKELERLQKLKRPDATPPMA